MIDAIGLLDRIIFFSKRYDIVSFLLSNRNIDTLKGLNFFIYETTTLEKIIGVGQSQFSEIFNYKRNSVEIDPFDTLFYYGFFGTYIFFSGMIGIFVGYSNALIHYE